MQLKSVAYGADAAATKIPLLRFDFVLHKKYKEIWLKI